MHMIIYIYVHIHTHLCIHIHVCTYLDLYICTCVQINIYIYIQQHRDIDIYTHLCNLHEPVIVLYLQIPEPLVAPYTRVERMLWGAPRNLYRFPEPYESPFSMVGLRTTSQNTQY